MRFRDAALIRAGGRNRVLRAWVDGIGSVVVKELLPGESLGLLDWACLKYVAEVAPGVAPRALDGDAERRYFVMEDLGRSRTLDNVLAEGPRETVFAVCREMARQTARLQAATLGAACESRFLEVCGSVPGAVAHDRAAEAERWLAGLQRLHAWLDAAGVLPADGFDAACLEIAACYADPGDWLALTHGDPAPTNTHVSEEGRVRLVDFEYGGFRHALYDVTAWWMLCPLPAELEWEVRAAYRDELTPSLPADNSSFSREWALIAAYRGLAIVSWLSLDVLQKDHEWAPGWSARARLIATAKRLSESTQRVVGLEPVAESAKRLEAGLGRLWPDRRGVTPHWPGLLRDA